jgi:hypothetical protein
LKGRKGDEEDVSSYCMALRKREDTGTWKRKQQIAISGELDLKEVMDLSQGRLCNEEF